MSFYAEGVIAYNPIAIRPFFVDENPRDMLQWLNFYQTRFLSIETQLATVECGFGTLAVSIGG